MINYIIGFHVKKFLKILIVIYSISSSAFAISMSPSCYVDITSKNNSCDIDAIKSTLSAYDVALVREFVNNHEIKVTLVTSANSRVPTNSYYEEYKKSGKSLFIINSDNKGCKTTRFFKEKDTDLIESAPPKYSSSCDGIDIQLNVQIGLETLKVIKRN
jgi:hypothetical protein